MTTRTLVDTDSVQIVANKWLDDVRQYQQNVDTLWKHGTINAALSNIGTSTHTTLVVTENTAVNANTDLTSYPNIHWLFLGSGKLTPATGVTLTLYSPDTITADPGQKILDNSAGTIVFSHAGTALAGWWGIDRTGSTSAASSIQSAMDALPTSGGRGGTVLLGGGVISIGTTTLIIPNRIRLKGEGRRTTIVNYSGTGTAIDCVDMNEGGGLEGIRLYVGTSTTAVGINIRNSATDVRRTRFDDLEIFGAANTSGQIGMQLVASGGHIISDNYFGDICLAEIAKPIIKTSTEGNIFSAIQIDSYGNTAGAIAIDSYSHDDQMISRVSGVQAAVSSPVAYKEQGTGNIVSIVADIGASPASALNISGIRNKITLSRPAGNTPLGTIGRWSTVSDSDITIGQRPSSRGNTVTTINLNANWGTTATVTSISGDDTRGQFTVNSAGTGQGANPTITVNFIDGTWPSAPFAIVAHGLGDQLTVPLTWTTTVNTLDIIFQGTPIAGQFYRINYMVIG